MQLVTPKVVAIGTLPPLPIFANGDSLTFVGPKPHSVVSLKTPVALLRRELKSTHATCCAQSCDSCGYDARYQLKDSPPCFFIFHS